MNLHKIFFFMSLVWLLTGCSLVKEDANHVLYTGQGEKWFSTYTVSKVNNSHFDSLYIQYVVDRSAPVDEQTQQKVGPIEYVLDGSIMRLESNAPQELKGIGNFHTATEANVDIFDYAQLPDELSLQIKWKGNTETIVLKKMES